MLDRAKTILYSTLVALGLYFGAAACNPFAPGFDDTIIDRNKLLGDRRNIDGFFEYFRNTYDLRDSLLYGRMIAPQFRFIWFDFANNNQNYWDRDQEMVATYNMFRSVKSATLIWNSYTALDTATFDTLATAERFFNLTIVQDEQNVYRGTGRARLVLTRPGRDTEWQIKEWTDISDR